MRLRTCLLALLVMAPLAAQATLEPAEHALFSGDAVHEIHLTFAQADWWDQLEYNYDHYDDIPYIAAEFDWDAVHFDSIGVRFKGNSSYHAYPGNKKSFKLDIDEYVSLQEIDGLDKLNLNNSFLDPSFVREKAAYELADAMGLAVCRTNFAALYINGSYWGLYTLVEQMDKQFIESRWGAGEDGNLWKGEPYGSLEYQGANESSYYSDYELKTNESVNDWSALVEMADTLNNIPPASLRDELHNVMDASSAMAMLAMDIFTVNLDSYIGRCANYYFYHRDLDSRMIFTKWDMNEAWGNFNMWGYSTTQLQQLNLHWTNPQYNEDRPLAEQMWQVSEYDDIYLSHIRRLMDGPADPDVLVARMETMRDLIRSWVYADPNKMFSNAEFESCMLSNVQEGNRTIPALETFIRNRDSYIRGQIGSWSPPEGLVINEIMPDNDGSVTDEWGDYDDWIEVANTSAVSINLSDYSLVDHHDGSTAFDFPSLVLGPGEYVVVWCDEEPGEGSLHAPFRLDASGEDVYLLEDAHIVDEVTYPAMGTDISWGRWADGTGDWRMLSVATPGAENENPTAPEDVVLYINEILASNDTGIQDETGAFEDWIELYNPGPAAVELGGLFLTDDLNLSTQWALPEFTLGTGEFLVIWCDSDPGDGALHANFKLSSGGETVALFGRLTAGNLLIDSYEFGAQTADISEGRSIDGGNDWVFFDPPTPGASNSDGTGVGDDELPAALSLLPAHPNPFNPWTKLSFDLPAAGRVQLEIFDVSGRRVTTLIDESREAGRHEIAWNGLDDSGRAVASGVYLSRLGTAVGVRSERLVLLR